MLGRNGRVHGGVAEEVTETEGAAKEVKGSLLAPLRISDLASIFQGRTACDSQARTIVLLSEGGPLAMATEPEKASRLSLGINIGG